MLADSVKAKQPDLVVELVTGSSDADKKPKSQAGEPSTDLVVKKAEEQALASMSNTLSKDEREALLAEGLAQGGRQFDGRESGVDAGAGVAVRILELSLS